MAQSQVAGARSGRRRPARAVSVVARPAPELPQMYGSGRLDLYGTGACFLASWALAAAASWIALRRPATNQIGSVPASSLMLRRGGRLATVTVTNQLQLNADLVAVGWTVGAAGAGNYWLASQVLVAGLLFANAAGQVALARMPVLVGDRDRFGHAVEGEIARILCLAVPAAAVAALASPWLLPPLFGAEHAAAASVLLWLLPWFVLQHPTTVLQAALTAAGREACVLRANLVGGDRPAARARRRRGHLLARGVRRGPLARGGGPAGGVGDAISRLAARACSDLDQRVGLCRPASRPIAATLNTGMPRRVSPS